MQMSFDDSNDDWERLAGQLKYAKQHSLHSSHSSKSSVCEKGCIIGLQMVILLAMRPI